MKHPTLPLWASAAVALALGSGCAGYRLGPGADSPVAGKTVQVVPFTNRTMEPRLADAVTAAVRKELQRDGSARLATLEPGDIVLTGELIQYRRRELSFVPDDIATARDYRVQLTARVTARERATGRVLLEQDVTGYTLIRVGGDLSGTERQALPLLAADLARQIRDLLVEGSW
ncbi:MAG: LptE family protein [Verrucomicrobiales bacterium]|nr:LptE family protein [Verrucomicrobiales bacterium]